MMSLNFKKGLNSMMQAASPRSDRNAKASLLVSFLALVVSIISAIFSVLQAQSQIGIQDTQAKLQDLQNKIQIAQLEIQKASARPTMQLSQLSETIHDSDITFAGVIKNLSGVNVAITELSIGLGPSPKLEFPIPGLKGAMISPNQERQFELTCKKYMKIDELGTVDIEKTVADYGSNEDLGTYIKVGGKIRVEYTYVVASNPSTPYSDSVYMFFSRPVTTQAK
jgi:hypothetical protein